MQNPWCLAGQGASTPAYACSGKTRRAQEREEAHAAVDDLLAQQARVGWHANVAWRWAFREVPLEVGSFEERAVVAQTIHGIVKETKLPRREAVSLVLAQLRPAPAM